LTMKKLINRLLLVGIPALAFSLQACQTAINPDDLPIFVQKIVVNVVGSNVANTSMEVSLTASPYDSTDFPEVIDNAIVQFKVNGNEQNFTYNSLTGKYENPGFFNPDDQLLLSVSLQNKSLVSAAVLMPSRLEALSTKLTVDGGIDATGNTADLLELSFDDNGQQANYYLLHYYYYSEAADIFLPFELTTNDAILKSTQTIKTNEGGYLFGDETFNGAHRKFSIVAPAGQTETNLDIKYLVEIHSLSRDYFVYLKTLQDFRDNEDNTGGSTTLGSAVIVHTNISGGLGIFGAQTVSSDTLR
jgi:hypothetical protein